MHYYDFKDNWSEFLPLLMDDDVKKVINYILDDIYHATINGIYTEQYKISKEFKDFVKSITNIEERREIIDSKPWGYYIPFLDMESEEEILDWEYLTNPDFSDKNRIEHYFYYHNCNFIVLLIYVLCIKRWPEHRWKLCSGVGHWWVMREDDPNTIYDFLWQYISKEDPSIFNDPEMKKFDHPYECLTMYLETANPRLSLEEIQKKLKWEDIQRYVEIKEAFSWIPDYATNVEEHYALQNEAIYYTISETINSV